MRAIPLLVLSLTLVACSGSNGRQSAPVAPTGPEAVALAPYAQRYAAIVTPVEVAIERFETESGALPRDASVDDFVVIARPFADAVATADAGLRQVAWPATALRHVKSEMAADKWLRLYLLGTLDVTLMIPAWRHQVISAANKVRDTRRMVSIDLGLISPRTSTA